MILLAVIVGAVGIYSAIGDAVTGRSQEADAWAQLSKYRRRSVLARHYNNFEGFLQAQTGVSIKTYYPGIYVGWKQNYTKSYGILVCEQVRVGSIEARVRYHGWDKEPSSMEYSLTLSPKLANRMQEGEFKQLLLQTQPNQTVRDRIGDVEWFSHIAQDGNVQVLLRIPYPTKWMDDIPEYDRAYFDTFYFQDVRWATRYLSKEVFKSEYTEVFLSPPVFNPPSHGKRSSIGTISGYIEGKDGNAISIEISTTVTTGLSAKRNFAIRIGHEPPTFLSREDAEALIKPGIASKGEDSRGVRIDSYPGQWSDPTASSLPMARQSPETKERLEISIHGPFEVLESYRLREDRYR